MAITTGYMDHSVKNDINNVMALTRTTSYMHYLVRTSRIGHMDHLGRHHNPATA